MLLCIIRGSAVKRIKSRGAFIDELRYYTSTLSKKIAKALHVEEHHNAVHLLVIIAQMRMILSDKFSYHALVKENRSITIKCVLKNGNEPMTIMKINGNTRSPKALEKSIVEAIIISIDKMNVSLQSKEYYLKILKERKEQIINKTK